MKMQVVLSVLTTIVGMTLFGNTLTFVGMKETAWNAAANWKNESGEPQAPTDEDDLYVDVTASGVGAFSISSKVTIPNDITFAANSGNTASINFGASGIVLSGSITFMGQARIKSASSGTHDYYFTGPVKTSSGKQLIIQTTSTSRIVHFQGRVTGNGIIYPVDSCGCTLEASDNEVQYLYMNGAKGKAPFVKLFARNALNESTYINFTVTDGYVSSASVTLNGYDQVCESVRTAKATVGCKHGVSSSASLDNVATLTMRATADRTYYGYFNGKISVVYNPTGDCVFNHFNATNTMTGALIVSNGTYKAQGTSRFEEMGVVVVADGAALELADAAEMPALTRIDLGTNAVFTAADTASVNSSTKWDRLSFAAGSSLTLPAGTRLTVETLVVDGDEVDGGKTYSPENLPEYIKQGEIVVPEKPDVRKEATWDGGAGADTRLSVAANWEGDVLPKLTGSSLVATFASDGERATTDGAVSLKGVVLSAVCGEGIGFTLDGDDEIGVGDEGVKVVTESAVTHVIAAPVAVTASSEWSVAAGETLVVSGDVSAAFADSTIVKAGTGTLELAGRNSLGDLFVISNGTVQVEGARLGGDGTIELSNRGAASCLTLNGADVGMGLAWKGPNDDNGNTYFMCAAGTSNVVEGAVSLGVKFRPIVPAGAVLHFRGGISGSVYVAPDGPGVVVVSGNPINGPCWYPKNYGTLVLRVANNKFRTDSGYGLVLNQNASCRTEVDYALNQTSARLAIQNGASLDLCGHDQQMGYFTGTSGDTKAKITSLLPATLKITQGDSDRNLTAAFTGCASLVKAGAHTLTSTRTNSSTGTVSVVAGTLAFDKGASWLGARQASASESGILRLEHSNVFGRKTDIVVASGGKLSLADGINQVVGDLIVNGEILAPGTYGSSAAVAAQHHRDDIFDSESSGMLTVRGAHPGLLLLFR